MHRQVAEAWRTSATTGRRIGELARHWFSANRPIDLSKAINYSLQAGDGARSASSRANALRYYPQSINLYSQANGPDPVLGINLAIGVGAAQDQTGDPTFEARSSTQLTERTTSVTRTATWPPRSPTIVASSASLG